MRKLAVAVVLVCAVTAAVHGMNIAYKNTKALGYDSNQSPFAFSVDDNGHRILRIYDDEIDLNDLFSI